MRNRATIIWAAVLLAVASFSVTDRAAAGWFGRASVVGAAVVGYEFETIAAGSLAAVLAFETPYYRAAVENLAGKIAAHPLIGPIAFRHGLKKAAKLYPVSETATASLESDLKTMGVLKADGPPDAGSDPKAPGKLSEGDGYKEPKNWDGKLVKAPNGKGYGYPAADGKVWVPTGPRPGLAHGGPHWDVQRPDGGYVNVYPGGRTR